MKKEKKADSCCSPFSGSGKLSDFKKDGSWMINQIEKGYENVQRGVTVDKSGDNIKFANNQLKIANKIFKASIDFKINKYYKNIDNNQFALKWFISGNLQGVNLKELCLINELLKVQIENDLSKICILKIADIIYDGNPCIDFNNKGVKSEYLLIALDSNLQEILMQLEFEKIQENENV